MRRIILAFAAVLGLTGAANAQYVAPGNTPSGIVLGHCALSVTTVVTLGSACTIPFGTTWAWVENEGAAFRWWSDGTTATTSSGMAGPVGTVTAPAYVAFSSSIASTQVVAQSGTTVLNIEFMR